MKLLSTTVLAAAAVTTALASVTPAPPIEEATDPMEDVIDPSQETPAWIHVTIDDVRMDRAEHGGPWEEFIRVPDLFTGLYEIPAGGEDRQSPHDADEVYYILAGRATAVVGADHIEVGPGSVLYVAKDQEHRFIDITQDLSVLVFFATTGDASG